MTRSANDKTMTRSHQTDASQPPFMENNRNAEDDNARRRKGGGGAGLATSKSATDNCLISIVQSQLSLVVMTAVTGQC